jgi:predicted CDP-diglyceride synthetase/phosphatidate cytidylyltransferase
VGSFSFLSFLSYLLVKKIHIHEVSAERSAFVDLMVRSWLCSIKAYVFCVLFSKSEMLMTSMLGLSSNGNNRIKRSSSPVKQWN